MSRLQDCVREQAENRPDATAVVLDNERMSYRELEVQSNQLANLLVDRGCSAGDRVAILAEKSAYAVVGILATLKAGGIYVPLDIGNPSARLARVLRSAEPRVLLGDDAASTRLVDVPDDVKPELIGLQRQALVGEGVASVADARDWLAMPASPPIMQVQESDVAYIMFTSGSTGQPKGVVITHGNVLSFLEWAVRHFGIRPEDRNSGHSPLCFDLSTLDLFGTFTAGAELHLVPAAANVIPTKLVEFIRSSELTQWFSVPSALNQIASWDAATREDLQSVQRVIWCGEVLPTPTAIYYMQRAPQARFTNLYGPTEATVASVFHDLAELPKDPREPIPIGRACAGESVVVVNDDLRPVPAGAVGELCITGLGLSPGYWKDAEQTALRFVATEAHGRLYRTGDLAKIDGHGVTHFVGRRDTQIKSRGYRIELGEVESALYMLDFLQEAAVVAVPSLDHGTVICCAYSLRQGVEIAHAGVRSALIDKLPAYMLPGRWLLLDELPKNVNGKIDRPALRARFEADD